MTATLLLVLAVLDGAFSGFRSSVGRTGLVDHRRSDLLAYAIGAGAVLLTLAPAMTVALLGEYDELGRAGAAALRVYLPYGALVLTALAAYGLLAWQVKYVASALILGPFTFARAPVAVAGGVAAVWAEPSATLVAVLAVAGVLVVEPLLDRLVYARTR